MFLPLRTALQIDRDTTGTGVALPSPQATTKYFYDIL